MYCTYITVNVIDGKWYYGSKEDHNEIVNGDYKGSGIRLTNAIKKYGPARFTTIIHKMFKTKQEMGEFEEYYLTKYDAAGDPMSYNLCNKYKGGSYKDGKTDEEMAEIHAKIGAANKGNNPYANKNEEEYKEWTAKIGTARIGKPAWNKGKTDVYSAETLAQMSASSKGQIPWNKGKTDVYSAETLAQKSASMSGENNPWYGITGENHPRYGKSSYANRTEEQKAETKAKHRAKKVGRKWCYNPNTGIAKLVYPEQIPVGYIIGRPRKVNNK